ncbi:MAG: hypothetical protein WCG44_01165 [bacterium]
MKSPLVPKSHTEQLKYVISCAVQAPSSHNTQPWKFSIEKNTISVYADLTRNLPTGDPNNRELYISVGTCLQNLISAAQALNCRVKVEYFSLPKSKELVATVEIIFPKTKTKPNKEILDAIWERRSNRTSYLPEKNIPQGVQQKIIKLATDHELKLNLIADRTKITAISKMVKQGMIEFLWKPAFRKELSRWIRHDWSKKGDGLPGYSIGLPGVISLVAPVLVQSTATIPVIALTEAKAVESCPVVGVLTIKKDIPLWWVKTGMTFEAIALHLETRGISTSILTAAVECPSQNIKLRKLVSGVPGLFFRLGYSTGPGISVPRRDGENVLR